MYATLKLLNSYFWKTIYGPILAFVFPVILLGILGNILRLEYVYPGIIALSMLFLGLIALPLAIMELKGSSLFKYIGSSPVNPIKFTLVAIGFYAFVAICTGVIICLATMAIFPTKTFPPSGFKHGVLGGIFTLKGVISFYSGCLIHLVLVIMTGLVISTFARTPQQALTLGLMITLPSMFLSGMVLSVDVIGESPVMNWISRFIPFRYSAGNMIIAATPIDQLGSALEYWMHVPFLKDNGKTGSAYVAYDLNTILGKSGNKSLNNMLDTLIWPNRSMTDPIVKANLMRMFPTQFPDDAAIMAFIKTLPGVVQDGSSYVTGYEAWNASGLPIEIFQNARKSGDWTLFNLLASKWNVMEISSDNNIFNWSENWGVKKIPSVDTLTEFVTKFFRGVDQNGQDLNGKDISGRVSTIADGIASGDFRWLEVFTHQSNILYYQADRVLNILLPLTLTGLGSWYVFKNFTWSLR